MDYLQERFDKMMSLYEELKYEIQQSDKHLYEQWKAGGFIVDDDVMSMYPNMQKCINTLVDRRYDDETDDEE